MPWNFQSRRRFEQIDQTGDKSEFGFQLTVIRICQLLAQSGRISPRQPAVPRRSPSMGMCIFCRTEHIYKELRFPDHAPMTVGYDFAL